MEYLNQNQTLEADRLQDKTVLSNVKSLYFIGIGGIGMSALARYFLGLGKLVSGYDRVSTNLTQQLEQEGVAIDYVDDINNLPTSIDLVVYTPAIPETNNILKYFRRENYDIKKRSEVLGLITESYFNICVAGTHGKTTTSSMIAHILRHTGFGCNAFLGGVSTNYNTNFWSHPNGVAVVEADEYDRSFLRLSPDVAIVTAMDPDHLDIYGTPDKVREAFITFSNRVKAGGLLLYKDGLKLGGGEKPYNSDTYSSESKKSDCYAYDILVENGFYKFSVSYKGQTIEGFELKMGGRHNIENAVASIAVALYLGIQKEKVLKAVADYKGVKRRFEVVLDHEAFTLIDDYAHHPQELEALIAGVRDIYPNRELTLVFQPHLYTRTKDFAEGFSASLSLADQALILPIYPARELPIKGVESQIILNKIQNNKSFLIEKNELLEWLGVNKPSLVVLAGAGDIDLLVKPVRELMITNY